jgi:hypothetical protein
MPQMRQKMAMGTRPSPGRTPSRLRMIEIVTTTATFVSMNRKMRLTMEVLILEEVRMIERKSYRRPIVGLKSRKTRAGPGRS